MMEKKFKICDCSSETWEVIIVDSDEQFEGRSTIYYHCDECGEDFAILDYFTRKVFYLHSKLKKRKV